MYIKPTVGRVVLFRPYEDSDIRHAATVAAVHEESTKLVNLSVVDANGVQYSRQNVALVDTEDNPELGQCEWMEYQKGQALMASEVEKILEDNITECSGKCDNCPDCQNQHINSDVVVIGDDFKPLTVIEIAELAHKQNTLFCGFNNEQLPPVWESLDFDEVDIRVKGVQVVAINTDISAEEMHEIWIKNKVDKGWELGDVIDYEKKTHPSLVSFSELSEFEVGKIQVFINVVRQSMGLSLIPKIV